MTETLAVTDRGYTMNQVTQPEVDFVLRALILTGHDLKLVQKECRERGLRLTKAQLTRWPYEQFRTRYYELREELASQVGMDLAGDQMTRAQQQDRLQAKLIELADKKAEEIEAKDLGRMIKAIADAKHGDIQMAQLLADKPTERKEVRTVDELVLTLRRLDLSVG